MESKWTFLSLFSFWLFWLWNIRLAKIMMRVVWIISTQKSRWRKFGCCEVHVYKYLYYSTFVFGLYFKLSLEKLKILLWSNKFFIIMAFYLCIYKTHYLGNFSTLLRKCHHINNQTRNSYKNIDTTSQNKCLDWIHLHTYIIWNAWQWYNKH